MGIEVLIAAIVIGGLVSATGSIVAGQQQKKMHEYNAAVAENNAISAKAWSEYNEEREREKQKARRSKMMSSFLTSGVQIDTGSPALVISEQAAQDELDALSIRKQGDAQAAQYRARADLERAEGKAAQTASFFEAGSTLVTTAGSAASANLQFGSGSTPTKTV